MRKDLVKKNKMLYFPTSRVGTFLNRFANNLHNRPSIGSQNRRSKDNKLENSTRVRRYVGIRS